MAPIRRSMAWTPYRPASHRSSLPPPGAGSMKWFIPPMRATRPFRHTAMQEPRTVLRIEGSPATSTPPMWMPDSGRSTDSRTRPTLSADLLVDAVAQVPKLGAHPEQRLRTAQEEVAAGPEQLDEPTDAQLLKGPVEVNEHVSAEDAVKGRPNGPRLRQVDPPEDHQVPDVGAHLHRSNRGACTADEALPPERRGHPRDLLRRVDTLLRPRHHLRLHVI